ncbi:glutathione S-transferase [Photobacterium sanctipauli]|uniref:Glutathione S-transferase n=1 Tax=Photobacterium sanctipauli TaxID=1342794 RepID=A0A2T3NIF4_9GAMM|nr:glutathione S-transferase N-terminal domain-containing protein [Photobacterium sanctipauli]PSW14733.1 glutathione S-transferase [Photobacterium sanctipauli]
MDSLPILYSLQRCPYAMRARLGLICAQQSTRLREVSLKRVPDEMRVISSSPTVPLMVLPSGEIINESLDIMLWALQHNDPHHLLDESSKHVTQLELVHRHDAKFIPFLERYKQATRRKDFSKYYFRDECEKFLVEIEQVLSGQTCIVKDKPCLIDYALLPFIRQFSRVERQWFLSSPYQQTHHWINRLVQTPIYAKAMTPFPEWQNTREDQILSHV